jgi:hypothetical protein
VTGSPTPDNYKTWRDGVEVSVVSASGRADEAVIFMKEINSTSTPSDLAANCPAHLKSLDSKYACSLRTALASAGLAGERILLQVMNDDELKFYFFF